MNTYSITNMDSPRSGRPVANQYQINVCLQAGDKDERFLSLYQSYNTMIAKVEGGNITLTEDWDCSRTTLKYLREFLGEDYTAKEIRRLIAKGYVRLVKSLDSFGNEEEIRQ